MTANVGRLANALFGTPAERKIVSALRSEIQSKRAEMLRKLKDNEPYVVRTPDGLIIRIEPAPRNSH